MRHLVAALLTAVCAATAALAGISAEQSAAALKTIEAQYGAEIRQARSTSWRDDDLQVARTLLKACDDRKAALAVRAELARLAVELAMPVGTVEAGDVARAALPRWADAVGMDTVERLDWAVKIRQAQLEAARGSDRKSAGEAMAGALMELSFAYEAAGDMDKASAALTRALGVAQSTGAVEVAADLARMNENLQRVRTVARELADLTERLAAAEAGNNPPLIQEIHGKLALLHLLKNADPTSAAPHLAKAQHAWAGGAAALARRSRGENLAAADYQQALDTLRAASLQGQGPARAELLEMQLSLCDELAKLLPAGSDDLKKIELLRQQALAALGAPAGKLTALRQAMGAAAGNLLLNADGSVGLSYTFYTSRDMKDWTTRNGAWTARDGQLSAEGGGIVHNAVRFKADAPMEVSFSAVSDGTVVAVLAMADQVDSMTRNGHLLTGPGGWQAGGLGGQIQRGPDTLSQPLRVRIVSDGKGQLTYWVNGQELAKATARDKLDGQQFRLAFQLRNGQKMQISGLSIRGTPWTPPAPATRPVPPAPQPPRRWPGR